MDAASILLVLATLGVSDGTPPSTNRTTEAAHAQQSVLGTTAVHHTAYFAGQPGWSSEATTSPPAAAPQYDRYGTPINVAAAPPSVIDRTRAAVVESGNALRDGVEAGFQEADRQLTQGTQQFIDNSRAAAQNASSQFQGWAGTTAEQAQETITNTFTPPTSPNTRGQATNPFAPPAAPATTGNTATRSRNGVQPPPWATGAAATNNDPSWPPASATTTPGTTASSGTVLPSPPLASPQLPAPPATSSPFTTPRTAQLPPIVVSQTAGGGWTTVNSNAAAPPMLVPRLVNTPAETQPVVLDENGSQLQPLVGSSGPGFPNNQINNSPSEHSLLTQSPPPGAQTQPQQPPAEAGGDFSIGWDRPTTTPQQATIGGGGRYGSAPPSGIASPANNGGNASQVTVRAPSSQQTPGNRSSEFDQWAKEDLWSNEAKSPQGNPPAGSQQPATPATGSVAANQPPATAISTNGQTVATAPPTSNEPWMPLVFAVSGLAGSIGANFFLGWSYMDARQKYRHLVQKTANKFRRSASAA